LENRANNARGKVMKIKKCKDLRV